MKNPKIKNTAVAAMLLAAGLVLPFITGQLQRFGNMLLPMHIPVLLCGLICGWQYGLIVGFITPLLRSAIFTMPQMYPNAVAMAFELAAYGSVAGFLYSHSKWQCTRALYKSIFASMLTGRIIWGIVKSALLGFDGFTLYTFFAGAFINAVPGIILQLIVIPAIMVALNRAKLVPFLKKPHGRDL